jgi:hypothetical protein
VFSPLRITAGLLSQGGTRRYFPSMMMPYGVHDGTVSSMSPDRDLQPPHQHVDLLGAVWIRFRRACPYDCPAVR